MIKKIKNTMTITLSILLILTTISFAEEGFSVPQEETSTIISLPANTVKGQFSGEVKGRIYTNLLGNRGDCEDTTLLRGFGGTLSLNSSDKIIGSNSIVNTANSETTLQITTYNADNPLIIDASKYYLVTVYVKSNVDNRTGQLRLREGITPYTIAKTVNFTYSTSWQRIGIIISPSELQLINLSNSPEISVTLPANAGDVIQTDGIMINEISSSEYAEGTSALLNKYNYVNDTKSTNSVRLTSVNKNLFDKDKLQYGYYYSASGSLTVNDNYACIKATLDKGTYYFKDYQDKVKTAVRDINGGLIISNTEGSFTLSQKSTVLMSFFDKDGSTNPYPYVKDSEEFQLEEGSTATDYVEHEKSEVYVDIPFNNGELTSVPNGTADSVDLNTGIATQRNKKYMLTADDITGLITTGVNTDLITLSYSNICDFIYANTGNNHRTLLECQTMISTRTQPFDGGTIDDVNSVWKHYFNGSNWAIIIPSGTYASLAEAQADLAGTELTYQLAEEQTYELPTTPLIAYPNGTIIIEPAVSNASIYNDGITIPESQPPVETLESIKKFGYDANGVLTITTIDLSNVSVTDGRHIQIDGANSGERYEYTYQYPEELTTIPIITCSVPIDQTGQLDGLTNMVEQNANLIDTIMKQIKTLSDEIEGIE